MTTTTASAVSLVAAGALAWRPLLLLPPLLLLLMPMAPRFGGATATEPAAYIVDQQLRQSIPLEASYGAEMARDSLDVEREILGLLGLSHRPSSVAAGALPKDSAAPKFMYRLYKTIQEEEGLADLLPYESSSYDDAPQPETRNASSEGGSGGWGQLAASDRRRPGAGSGGGSTAGIAGSGGGTQWNSLETLELKGVDVVMSFTNKGVKTSRGGIEKDDDKRYYFDVREVRPTDVLQEAELRVYKQGKREQQQQLENFRVNIYRVLRLPTGRHGIYFLDSIAVNSSYDGWLVFNVTEALAAWLTKSENSGLLMKVYNNYYDVEIEPHRAGIVGRQGPVADKQAFMVAFFKAPNDRKLHLPAEIISKRMKRDVGGSGSEPTFWDEGVKKSFRKTCQRRSLYVSFKHLKFEDWIIAPDGYPAFYCSGECSFPLNAQMNATNHAIVQTLVSLINPKKVPKACCAPKKLSSVSVLYFDDNSNVVLKKFRNMVVQSCGCH